MDIARDICTDSFYIVNSGLPCIAITAVLCNLILGKILLGPVKKTTLYKNVSTHLLAPYFLKLATTVFRETGLHAEHTMALGHLWVDSTSPR